MSARLCAFGLIGVQLVALLLVSGATGTVALLSLAAAIAATGLRIPLAHRLQTSTPYVVLAVLSVAKLAFAPYEVPPGRDFVNTKLTLELATYCILSQVLILLGWPGRRLPMAIPFIAGVALVGIYNVDIGSARYWTSEMTTMLTLAVCAALLSALFFRRQRRRLPGSGRSRGLMGLSLGLAAAFGGLASLGLNRYEGAIEEALVRLVGGQMGGGRIGYSHAGTLGNMSDWRMTGDERIALRIFGPPDTPPGYLKGRTFSSYTPYRQWNVDAQSRPKSPLLDEPIDLPPRTYGTYIFELDEPNVANLVDLRAQRQQRERAVAEARAQGRTFEPMPTALGPRVSLQMWPERHLPAGFFTPIQATHLAAETPTLSRDAQGNLDRDKENAYDPYTLFVPPGSDRLDRSPAGRVVSAPRMAQYLEPTSQSGGLQQAIAAVAPDVFDGAETFSQKLDAVTAYFADRYTYKLTGPDDAALDPIVDFLQNRDSGHCELFASATVLLLRHEGIPARYCTGLVAAEYNDAGGYWLARDADAHAWVEVWDSRFDRWLLLETTPASGVPTGGEHGGLGGQVDAWRMAIRRFARAWETMDVRTEVFDLANSIASTQFLLGIGIACGLLAALLRWRQRGERLDPRRERMRQMRLAIEQRLARSGLDREDSETLSDFADRVADAGRTDAAAWLRSLVRVRYRPLPADPTASPEGWDELRETYRTAKASLRRRAVKPAASNEPDAGSA